MATGACSAEANGEWNHDQGRLTGNPWGSAVRSAVLEGEWHGQQTVMLEFESVEAAKAWYNSPEYQAVIGERHAAATSNGAIFEQFSMPGS